MYIYPAIDLYNGACVRLVKGDFNQKTVYSHQPVEIAKKFMESGANKLHVVDLNGAESDNNANYEMVKRIVKAVDISVQVGGGVRSLKSAQKYLSIGVDRVIIGTKAVEDIGFLTQLIDKFGDRLVVAVDVKDGFVAINGWKDKSEIPIMDFINQLQQVGVKRIICTDISRDGLLQGSNIELYKEIQRTYNMELIASGGVSSIEEIKTLESEGLFGVILGKALYEKKFTLEEALTC